MFNRNGSNWIDEKDYNTWAVNETIIILDNTEVLYIAYQNYIKQNQNHRLYRLVYETMLNESIKIKKKNIKAVMNELKENYKNESES